MQTSHTGAIKGLSIAVIVIAALGILGSIICGVLLGFSSAIINDLGPMAASGLHEHGFDHGFEYQLDISDQQAASVAAMLVATIGGAVSIWVLICHVLILIAGIIGLRNCNKPEKLGQTFAWAIVGAIASLVGGGFITMILCIVVAVFANSDKKLAAGYAAAPTAYAAPTAAYAAPAYAAPGAQPAQAAAPGYAPVAQPMQTDAYAQPAQTAQPAQQAQPVQPDQPGAPMQ